MLNKLEDHNYYGIHATIIGDSLNPEVEDARITTFLVTFPRIVLAEFNTHRMLSRNSASSRAIPFPTMLKRIKENPFIPIKWMRNHKGMQGEDFFTDHADISFMRYQWLEARDQAIQQAEVLAEHDLTKQIVNRLLEPFLWHTAIVTATEWENFFALRAHGAAEIHIADLAEKMLEQMNASTPNILQPGEWHIPFGDRFDHDRVQEYVDSALEKDSRIFTEDPLMGVFNNSAPQRVCAKIATARMARTSYVNFDGTDDYFKDVELHDRLCHPNYGHWSPFEHSAFAMSSSDTGLTGSRNRFNLHVQAGMSGNFRGFIQYRKLFQNENKSDERLIKNRK